MKIAIIGYGKMGKTIEAMARKKGHEVIFKVDREDSLTDLLIDLSRADVAFEFSEPESAFRNIMACFDANVPVVSGTTGWQNEFENIQTICLERNQAFFYASNFSIGVNLFYEVNKRLAELMNKQENYDEVFIHETHHIQKLDSPSGTAITLAGQILENIDRLSFWRNYKGDENYNQTADEVGELPIFSSREEDFPGTHIVKYFSDVDEIEIIHKALSRDGFAQGAIAAGEWLIGKKGVFAMQDLLRL